MGSHSMLQSATTSSFDPLWLHTDIDILPHERTPRQTHDRHKRVRWYLLARQVTKHNVSVSGLTAKSTQPWLL